MLFIVIIIVCVNVVTWSTVYIIFHHISKLHCSYR